MALYFSSLNSGSNGNCYYIGNEAEAVLVDVGISCREIEKRMLRSGLELKKVKAIFISHEHSDHIRGVHVLSRKYQIPVYITPDTHKSGAVYLEEGLAQSFSPYQKITIGSIEVTAFPKSHDAADPHSFIVCENNITIGVLTDIGVVCDHVKENFKQCHAVFLEANYDAQMLDDGIYPYYLKERIKSDKGHLSNHQAVELFINHKAEHLSHLILSHLSKENNSPQAVLETFLPHAGDVEVIVASRLEETKVFCISTNEKEETTFDRNAKLF